MTRRAGAGGAIRMVGRLICWIFSHWDFVQIRDSYATVRCHWCRRVLIEGPLAEPTP